MDAQRSENAEKRMTISWKREFERFKLPIILAVFIALGYLVYRTITHQELPEAPKTILHLGLTSEAHGERARQLINALDPHRPLPDDNVIGTYQSTDGGAVLCLSGYETQEKTEAALAMQESFEQQNPNFKQFRSVHTKQWNYSVCLEQNHVHYLFLRGNVLYWYSADDPIARSSFEALMQALPQ
jgi:hypothetical protein